MTKKKLTAHTHYFRRCVLSQMKKRVFFYVSACDRREIYMILIWQNVFMSESVSVAYEEKKSQSACWRMTLCVLCQHENLRKSKHEHRKRQLYWCRRAISMNCRHFSIANISENSIPSSLRGNKKPHEKSVYIVAR